MFGHEESHCKKKGLNGGVRTEWRPVQQSQEERGNVQLPSQQPEDQQISPPGDGFITVSQRNTAKKKSQDTTQLPEHQLGNSFQALESLMPMSREDKESNGGGVPPMDSIIAWNIRGLNWPNKQEDLKAFLHTTKIGIVGLMETKIKMNNDRKVASNTFPGWRWDNNSTPMIKGRVWIAWHPRSYDVKVLKKSEQFIHCYATQMSTNKGFFITFVYGLNQEQQRKIMWEDLQLISQHMTEAWCILGDFNAILYKEDRRGGNDVLNTEIREMADFIENGDLQEMKWHGPYYT